ncbi:hypothetical protein M0R04_05550 [Candidatus Dojkabacteria bacterium]|jgi:hypothetical protein|nr:hypothetical protein [Candidatus Dojkabacteria bacterium]
MYECGKDKESDKIVGATMTVRELRKILNSFPSNTPIGVYDDGKFIPLYERDFCLCRGNIKTGEIVEFLGMVWLKDEK